MYANADFLVAPGAAGTFTQHGVGYVGSHGYHELIGIDANEPLPVICPASPCPAVYPTGDPNQPTSATNSPTIGFPIGSPLAGAPVPVGRYYIPAGTPKANPALANTWTWFSEGTSSYNALQADVTRRFSHGLSFRGVYTVSKALDDGGLQLQFRAEMFNLLNRRGSDHQRGHNGATNPIRPEAGLVDLRNLSRYGSSGLPSAFGSVKPTSFASVGAISIISITPSF